MVTKILVNPSFPAIIMELQDAFIEGWRVDPVNAPADNFMYSEIYLIKDEAEDKPQGPENEFFKGTEIRKPGRPARKAA